VKYLESKAKLISYSQPTPILKEELADAQELIAFAARVSNPSNQFNSTTAEKLIRYLIKHKHWSPLEMVSVCLELETTRDIGRQLLRHRSFSFQEFSQRYADPTKDMKFVLREARLQDAKNRQNSIDTDDSSLKHIWWQKQDQIIYEARLAYKWAIDNGIAKEQARALLPEGNTMSRLYVNGTMRSWIHYIDLRSRDGTQKEHMQLANECAYAISGIFPMIEDFNH